MTMTGAADCAERRQGVSRRMGRMNLIARDKSMGAKVRVKITFLTKKKILSFVRLSQLRIRK
jgi:hypothetical protein